MFEACLFFFPLFRMAPQHQWRNNEWICIEFGDREREREKMKLGNVIFVSTSSLFRLCATQFSSERDIWVFCQTYSTILVEKSIGVHIVRAANGLSSGLRNGHLLNCCCDKRLELVHARLTLDSSRIKKNTYLRSACMRKMCDPHHKHQLFPNLEHCVVRCVVRIGNVRRECGRRRQDLALTWKWWGVYCGEDWNRYFCASFASNQILIFKLIPTVIEHFDESTANGQHYPYHFEPINPN